MLNKFPKTWIKLQGQMSNQRHQTLQRQAVKRPENALQIILTGNVNQIAVATSSVQYSKRSFDDRNMYVMCVKVDIIKETSGN